MYVFNEQIEEMEEKLNTTIPYNCSVVEACLALDNKLGATLTYMDWILSMKPGKLWLLCTNPWWKNDKREIIT